MSNKNSCTDEDVDVKFQAEAIETIRTTSPSRQEAEALIETMLQPEFDILDYDTDGLIDALIGIVDVLDPETVLATRLERHGDIRRCLNPRNMGDLPNDDDFSIGELFERYRIHDRHEHTPEQYDRLAHAIDDTQQCQFWSYLDPDHKYFDPVSPESIQTILDAYNEDPQNFYAYAHDAINYVINHCKYRVYDTITWTIVEGWHPANPRCDVLLWISRLPDDADQLAAYLRHTSPVTTSPVTYP